MIKTIRITGTFATDPGGNIEFGPGTLTSSPLADLIKQQFVSARFHSQVFHYLTITLEQDTEHCQ